MQYCSLHSLFTSRDVLRSLFHSRINTLSSNSTSASGLVASNPVRRRTVQIILLMHSCESSSFMARLALGAAVRRMRSGKEGRGEKQG